jgi:hypothetical protein
MEKTNPDSIAAMLTMYRCAVGVIVPLAIVIIGVLGKKVSRGGSGWQREDFHAGTELTLAGISGALVNLFEFLKPENVAFGALQKKLLGGNISIALLGFLFYYLTLSLKQDFGPTSGKSNKKQHMMMLGVSNVIGLAVLVGALLLMAP